jgi:hypothetical protein
MVIVPASSHCPRTDAQRRFDALVAIFPRAYAASGDGKMPDPVVNLLCDQRTLDDLLSRAGIVLAKRRRPRSRRVDQPTDPKPSLAEFVRDPTADVEPPL